MLTITSNNKIKSIKATGRLKKLKITKISEATIGNALHSGEDHRAKAKSSIVKDEVYIYSPQIDWEKWDLNGIVEMMMDFSTMTSGITLRPYQKELQKRIFRSVLLNDGEEITALFARQSGKTETVAITANTLMVYIPTLAKLFPKQLGRYAKGFHIGLFAPVNDQAYTTHERMHMRLSSDAADEILTLELDIQTKYVGGTLHIQGPPTTLASGRKIPSYHSFCRVQSAAKQAKVESKTYDLIFIEEAQDVASLKVQKSIHPMLAATNGTIVKIGTTTSFISDFYKAIQRNKRRIIGGGIQNHFEFDYRTVQRYSPLYKAYVAKEKERLGEDSDAFQMAYALQWMIEKEIALSTNQFEEYMNFPAGQFEYESDGHSVYVGGLDLAKKHDSTVLTVARLDKSGIPGDTNPVKTIVNWLEMKGDDWEDQFKSILNFVYNYNLSVLCVDSTGVGDPIVERLEKALIDVDCEIVRVIFTQPSKHEMATIFYAEMRKRRINVPTHSSVKRTRRYKNFIEQFSTCRKMYKGSFMNLTKQDEKNAHDDYVDSLLLLLYGAKQNITPVVNRQNNVFKTKSTASRSGHSKRYKAALERANRKVARWQ